MNTQSTFAKRLLELRKEMGLDQSQLANEIGITRGSISFYETGSRKPDIDILSRLCCFFHVPSDYLIGLTDNREFENVDIGDRLGLSDNAISKLTKFKSNKSLITMINFLIGDSELLTFLRKYLMGFIKKELEKNGYGRIPLRDSYPDYDPDVCFSSIIRNLPKKAEDIEYLLKDDEELVDELMLEYLAEWADVRECKKMLYIDSVKENNALSTMTFENYEPDEDVGISGFAEIEAVDDAENISKWKEQDAKEQEISKITLNLIKKLFKYMDEKNAVKIQ